MLLGQAAHVPRGGDALHRHAPPLELAERGLGLFALADQLAEEAVPAAGRRHEDVPDAREPHRGLGPAADRRDQLADLLHGLGEQSGLRVAERVVRELGQAVEDAEADGGDVLGGRAVLDADHVVRVLELVGRAVDGLAGGPRVVQVLGRPHGGRGRPRGQLGREARAGDADHGGRVELLRVDLGDPATGLALDPLRQGDHEPGVGDRRADHPRERCGGVRRRRHHGGLDAIGRLLQLVGSMEGERGRYVLGQRRVPAPRSDGLEGPLVVGVAPEGHVEPQPGRVHREGGAHRAGPEHGQSRHDGPWPRSRVDI